jgi:hypothetical protein
MLEALAAILTVPAFQALVANYAWTWPVCEITHYVGMSLVVGVVLALDLRILGLFKRIAPGALQPFVPWAIGGFIANLISGFIMVAGNEPDASFYVLNLSFQLKILAMFLALLNLLIFRLTGLEKLVYALPAGADTPATAKFVALVSLTAWVFTILFGRLLMYNSTLLNFLGL